MCLREVSPNPSRVERRAGGEDVGGLDEILYRMKYDASEARRGECNRFV